MRSRDQQVYCVVWHAIPVALAAGTNKLRTTFLVALISLACGRFGVPVVQHGLIVFRFSHHAMQARDIYRNH